MKSFPIRYFSIISSPTKIFKKRQTFTWWMLALIFLFLTSLLMVPVSLHFVTNQVVIPLTEVIPNTEPLLNDQVAVGLQEVGGKSTTLTELAQTEAGIVGTNLDEETINNYPVVISFNEDNWFVKDTSAGKDVSLTMDYIPEYDFFTASSGQALQTLVNKSFFETNYVPLVTSNMFNIWLILFLMTGILVIGASFFLWLTRKSQFSTIHDFKESVTISLLALSLGSVLAMVYGIVSFNIVTMLTIQSIAFLLILLLIYVKTHFVDEEGEGGL